MRKHLAGWLLLLAAHGGALAADLADATYSQWVSDTGDITLPDNFRQAWVHLGSWLVEDEAAPGYGFHDVYTQPQSLAHYRRTGDFPDGAVLVKEVRSVAAGAKTTGLAQWAAEPLIWFVMVKDSSGQRFPDNPHWGLGWGWGLYEAAAPKKNVSASYRETCLACHTPAKDTDWVFIEGYPSLAVQPAGAP